ncbi:MAG: hypothetical protein KBD53_09135 [Candidatus Omnitrophica bacterium]|nr:hypothetical protein [Candidatus Omnitrophota bacterium]
MKKVCFKRNRDLKKGTKFLHIFSRSENPESVTVVRKGFFYKVSKINEVEPTVAPPEVYIRKYFDTRQRIEKFSFRVKGVFYMSHGRFLMRVEFHHSLNIKIVWKNKKISPKKSEVLT